MEKPEPILEIYYSRLKQAQLNKQDLEKQYENKLKGPLYFDRSDLVDSQIQAYQKRIRELGQTYNLVRIIGTTEKKISDTVSIKQHFEILLTHINVKDAAIILKELIPNPTDVQISEVKVGIINYIL